MQFCHFLGNFFVKFLLHSGVPTIEKNKITNRNEWPSLACINNLEENNNEVHAVISLLFYRLIRVERSITPLSSLCKMFKYNILRAPVGHNASLKCTRNLRVDRTDNKHYSFKLRALL